MTTWVFEGPIRVWSQEGGYASPAVEVGGHQIPEFLELKFGDENNRREPPPKVRLTIEVLEPDE